MAIWAFQSTLYTYLPNFHNQSCNIDYGLFSLCFQLLSQENSNSWLIYGHNFNDFSCSCEENIYQSVFLFDPKNITNFGSEFFAIRKDFNDLCVNKLHKLITTTGGLSTEDPMSKFIKPESEDGQESICWRKTVKMLLTRV